MTFGVSRDHGEFEWSGTAEGIFAQRSNVFSLRMWRMIFDIVRFNQFALDLLGENVPQPNGHVDVREKDEGSGKGKGYGADMSIGEYLKREGYSQAFTDDYLIPMTAAVWSTSPDKASLNFPAITLVRFMWNHHLLSTLATRPDWYTIPGGSQQYIDAIVKNADTTRFHVHTNTPIQHIKRVPTGGKRQVICTNPSTGQTETQDFDHIIIATHGDEILPLLTPSQSASPLEESILSTFETTENIAYLHSDTHFAPRRRAAWTAWNYLTTSSASELAHPAGVSLTYWMNLLQHIPEHRYGPVLVTMNPSHPPDPAKTQGKFVYRHPLYTPAAVSAQARLAQIQNVDGLSYAGAWTKYGFHEDGFSSGLKVAVDHLGAKLPFGFVDSTYSRGRAPVFDARDRVLRAMVLSIQRVIVLAEWVLGLPLVGWVLVVLAEAHDMLVEIMEGERGKWRHKLQ